MCPRAMGRPPPKNVFLLALPKKGVVGGGMPLPFPELGVGVGGLRSDILGGCCLIFIIDSDFFFRQNCVSPVWAFVYCFSCVFVILCHCTMISLSTRSCLKSNKLRPILNGQFCHAISKNIVLNLFGSKQPREILVFVIFKL